MTDSRPIVVILAGPNGAGKSTVAPALLQGALGVTEFVNADEIARGLSAFNPEGAAIAAGRVMLSRLRELAQQRVSFAFDDAGEPLVRALAGGVEGLWLYGSSRLPLVALRRTCARAGRSAGARGRA